MKQRLPSLLAIRYFEAVGRNLSFTLAANELNVTQAAVSHQVRLLEQELGAKLFTRLHQRIELTKQGIELLEVATECFDKLSDVTNSMSGRKQESRIHLSVSPLLSAGILMPRIGDFLNSEKGTEIIIHHSLAPPSDKEPSSDIKIFFSHTPLNDEAYEFLFKDGLIPMCVPALWRGHEDQMPSEFLQNVSIVHEFDYQWWEEWCERAGVEKSAVQRGLALDDPAVLENAALLGRGVILGSKRFLAERLSSGELITPLGAENRIDIYYYLFSGAASRRRDVAKFAKWLRAIGAEIRETDEIEESARLPEDKAPPNKSA
ncbi:LysR family transcriptional regulator [Rhizobium sp. 16-449-1b]|uniref:LysR family transcriptional regulator n=1 Tax=Rhizobium sp. 16-449-1b TaxID=2819989 RepID=UPI001AD9BD0C|nr:LysR family transcriptional regulator [Rhizobium sp. 16-449-1b]MBO9195409.1 LysR family transcriptional regulator [Rhizobium sp. 16-449-1b]